MTEVVPPKRIAKLPIDPKTGHRVPWFVEWIDGVPDFRIADSRKIRAGTAGACWICGEARTGSTSAFVVGPMCAVNRVSAEPPSHRECAVYAATVCPFLVKPSKRRRVGNVPDDAAKPAGIMIERNPGVALVWISRNWKPFADPDGGILFDIGTPIRTLWFAEGRRAYRSEILEAMESGLPLLAEHVRDADDERALREMYERALSLVPA